MGSLREHLVPRIQGQSGREQAVLMKCESMAVGCLWLCVDGRLRERACVHLEAMGPRGPHMAASCLCLSLSAFHLLSGVQSHLLAGMGAGGQWHLLSFVGSFEK